MRFLFFVGLGFCFCWVVVGVWVRHALTVFASVGLVSMLVAGGLLVVVVGLYNVSRVVDVGLGVAVFVLFFFGEAMLVAAVASYVASRRGYVAPPLPDLPRVSTVALVPAFNEGGRIGGVVREAGRFVDLVVVVDDGSTDGTAVEAEGAGAVVVRHPRNMGYGAAVRTLMRAALACGARYAVLLDADGQHDPGDVPRFLEALRGGADVAVGNRFRFGGVPLHRRFGIAVIRLVLRLMGVRVGDPENGFRGFTRRALEVLEPALEETWMGVSAQTLYLAARAGLRVVEVPVRVRYGGDTSSEPALLHGLSILWTLAWTWVAHNPGKGLALGLAGMAGAAGLLMYVAQIFNETRYIRLSFTSAALVVEALSAMLLAVSIAMLALRGWRPVPGRKP